MKRNRSFPVIPSKPDALTLRKYFRAYFSSKSYGKEDWLFPGQRQNEHVNIKTIQGILMKLKNNNQTKKVTLEYDTLSIRVEI
ncbi:MAG: site-specific recombinase XerD [Firmicutes bacterium]|nr:site-specific recombinase XerD [Bacillota bacterium]